ncbi:AAA family ATPase [Pseudomonas syringae]|uniref:AAA family ATPase n=1 Tax=Pseudomonas syringae TaxID=317 RepID=UPI002A75C314|nr:AAA family ATPase [Pseudomonas syringae]MDY2562292.1 AAA family ATPase [Pseudomonas syringae]
MRIQHLEFANFRKLKSFRIELAAETTFLVGANNSCKSLAMLTAFLKADQRKRLPLLAR